MVSQLFYHRHHHGTITSYIIVTALPYIVVTMHSVSGLEAFCKNWCVFGAAANHLPVLPSQSHDNMYWVLRDSMSDLLNPTNLVSHRGKCPIITCSKTSIETNTI